MLILSSIAVDPKLAQGGVWANYMGGEFLLARKGPAFQARLGELYTQNKEVIDAKDDHGLITVEGVAKMQEIHTIAFCEHILLNWRNVGEKGQGEIAYTPEIGTKLLLNPLYAELAAWLENYSNNHYYYLASADHEVATTVKDSAVS
jgi:hypothetical protein